LEKLEEKNVAQKLKEQQEREAKQPKAYLGNGKVVWNSGTIVNATKAIDEQKTASAISEPITVKSGLTLIN